MLLGLNTGVVGRSSLGDPVVTALAHPRRNDRVLPRRPWISCHQRAYVPACRGAATCLHHDRSLEADVLALPGMRAIVSHYVVVRERVRSSVRALRSAAVGGGEKSGIRDRGPAYVAEGPVRNSEPYGCRRSRLVLALTAHYFSLVSCSLSVFNL
jgi:hypothetical protein